MSNVVKNCSVWETHFFFAQSWSIFFWRIVLLQVSAGILFSSSPSISMFLRCLFGLPSVLSCRNTYIEYGWTWYICQYNDCLKFVNSWGDPFVKIKLPSLMSNVVKNWSFWETNFFAQSWCKSYWRIVCIVLLQVPACILFSTYLCFSLSLFGLPSVISCRSSYIEYGWTWYSLSMQWLPYLVICRGTLLWTSNCLL